MRKVFVTSICDQLWHDARNIIGCLDLSKQYLLNATFGTSIAYHMSVMERLYFLIFLLFQNFLF